jgi:hypothetical protein
MTAPFHRQPCRSFALFLILLLLSCSGSRPEDQLPPELLFVRNDNWQDLAIFVVSMTGATRRLGDVKGVNQQVFVIPGDIADGTTIRILVEPIGTSDYFITDQIVVSGLQRISLRVSPYLASSNWVIENVETSEGE